MELLQKKAYVFGMIFLLSNKMQALGDKLDPQLTVNPSILQLTAKHIAHCKEDFYSILRGGSRDDRASSER